MRLLLLAMLLSLSGCGMAGGMAVATALSLAAQSIGVVDQGERLVHDTWLDLHPAKACPMPIVPKATPEPSPR